MVTQKAIGANPVPAMQITAIFAVWKNILAFGSVTLYDDLVGKFEQILRGMMSNL